MSSFCARSPISCDHRGRRAHRIAAVLALDDLRDAQPLIRLLSLGDTSFSGVFPPKIPSKAKLQGGLCRHFIRVPITYEARDTVAEGLIKPYNPNCGRTYATYVPHMGIILFARHFHIGAEGIVLVGLLAAIIASQLLQRVVLLLVNGALLVRCPRCSFQAIGRYLPLHARMASCALWRGMPLYVAVGLMPLTHSTLMLSGSFRRVRRGVVTNMRVGFMGARPSMAMTDSPKSTASGPTDMTAQAYVSLGSLARASGPPRTPAAEKLGRPARNRVVFINVRPSEGASRRSLLAAANDRKDKARSSVPRFSGRGPSSCVLFSS